MTTYGYARVSSREQDLGGQVDELLAHGCAKVFQEKCSGAQTGNRPELRKVLRRLESGDVLLVCRLDRLARSVRDLLHILATVAERGASFKSLKEAWADTTTAHGRLFVTILGGISEFERELIRSRCAEGTARAKRRGVRFGRPHKLTEHQRQEALTRLRDGETQTDIARSYNVSTPTISRLARAAAVLAVLAFVGISSSQVAMAQACTTRPAVGGGTITHCDSGTDRQRVCTSRPAVGGGTITQCR